MHLTEFTNNYIECGIYKYYMVENVINYQYYNFNSYIINNNTFNNISKDYYLILDTTFSNALFHWIAECVIFFPLFNKLKNKYPTLKIVCQIKQGYHDIIGKYFGINKDDIIYQINNQNNICFFPKPITALNNNSICDEYKLYAENMISLFNNFYYEKNIDILILPRQYKQNSTQGSGLRISNCSNIINNIPNIKVLNTDQITDINEQIELIKKSKIIIVSDGSPYLFNGLFAINSKIIVLGNEVYNQCNNFKKMNYYNNLIKTNNEVIFIPYMHGDFNNNNFLFDDIKDYINLQINSTKNRYSIVIPTRGSGDAYNIFINYSMKLYEKYLIREDIFEFILVCPEINKSQVINDIQKFNFNFKVYSDEEIIDKKYHHNNNWCKQMLVKLAICNYIKTEYYFIIDDDMILTKSLGFYNFFDNSGKIYYSYEGYSNNSPLFQNNTVWLEKSCQAIGGDLEYLKKQKNIMGVTPQLFKTKIVDELISHLGENWEIYLFRDIATEFQLYWQFLIKTNRTDLYTPDNRFYLVDDSIHLIDRCSDQGIIEKVKKGYQTKINYFVVLQSHLKYPYSILSHAIEKAIENDN